MVIAIVGQALWSHRTAIAAGLLALIVWSELGHDRLRRSGGGAFGRWMLVPVGAGALLPVFASTTDATAVVACGIMTCCPVLAVTVAILMFRPQSRAARAILAAVAGFLALPVGLLLAFLAARLMSCAVGPCGE